MSLSLSSLSNLRRSTVPKHFLNHRYSAEIAASSNSPKLADDEASSQRSKQKRSKPVTGGNFSTRRRFRELTFCDPEEEEQSNGGGQNEDLPSKSYKNSHRVESQLSSFLSGKAWNSLRKTKNALTGSKQAAAYLVFGHDDEVRNIAHTQLNIHEEKLVDVTKAHLDESRASAFCDFSQNSHESQMERHGNSTQSNQAAPFIPHHSMVSDIEEKEDEIHSQFSNDIDENFVIADTDLDSFHFPSSNCETWSVNENCTKDDFISLNSVPSAFSVAQKDHNCLSFTEIVHSLQENLAFGNHETECSLQAEVSCFLTESPIFSASKSSKQKAKKKRKPLKSISEQKQNNYQFENVQKLQPQLFEPDFSPSCVQKASSTSLPYFIPLHPFHRDVLDTAPESPCIVNSTVSRDSNRDQITSFDESALSQKFESMNATKEANDDSKNNSDHLSKANVREKHLQFSVDKVSSAQSQFSFISRSPEKQKSFSTSLPHFNPIYPFHSALNKSMFATKAVASSFSHSSVGPVVGTAITRSSFIANDIISEGTTLFENLRNKNVSKDQNNSNVLKTFAQKDFNSSSIIPVTNQINGNRKNSRQKTELSEFHPKTRDINKFGIKDDNKFLHKLMNQSQVTLDVKAYSDVVNDCPNATAFFTPTRVTGCGLFKGKMCVNLHSSAHKSSVSSSTNIRTSMKYDEEEHNQQQPIWVENPTIVICSHQLPCQQKH